MVSHPNELMSLPPVISTKNVPNGPPQKWAPTSRVFSASGAHGVHAPCIAGNVGA